MSAAEQVVVTTPEPTTDTPLRVLFVSHTYVVGVNQGKLQAIAQSLLPPAASDSQSFNSRSFNSRSFNSQVALLTPTNWKSLEWNRPLPPERSAHLQFYAFPIAFTGRGGAHFYAPWHLWQVLRDFQPDVVQVEEEVFSLCALEFALWSRLTGKPLVVFGWENQDRRLSPFRHWVRQFVLDTAKLIIAGNHDGAKLLADWGYGGLIEVMPQMGVDPEFFRPEKSSSADSAEFTIGFLGRLVPEKGIDTLLDAVQRLSPCRLMLCGSGSAEADLKQAASDRNLPVTWLPSVPHDQAPDILRQFDVLVLPSRTTPAWKEQFGHVLIEAMAMAIPVVGSDSGEIPHVIGRSDLVFAEGDSVALAKILQRLISRPAWRHEVQDYCLKRVQQLYTHDRIAARLIALWGKIIGGDQ
jgi:glycosyltransferase involved in cell wall biosynthesis